MNYDKFTFFYPPRPEHKILPVFLNNYEKQGNWVAQAKMNGTYNFIGISPDKKMYCLKRDGSKHRNWQPGPENEATFQNLPGDGWYVFCAELMNDKTPHIKNINYIHDIIVDSGEMLLGSTYIDRYYRLSTLFNVARPKDNKTDHYLVIDDHTWLATIYDAGFESTYKQLIRSPEIEGLVLKNTNTELSLADMSKGMVKIRKPTKNYGF